MRKIGLMLGALLVSFSCYAGSTSLGTDVKSAMLKNNSAKQTNSANKDASIIYGGQDFSHRVAVAHESIWSGQPDLVG